MDMPCPHCDVTVNTMDELMTHVLTRHSTGDLTKLLRNEMRKRVTRDDFVRSDSHWIYVVDGFYLTLAPDNNGKFKLAIFGSVQDIPAGSQEPTEPEWEVAEVLTNKFIDAFLPAKHKE